MAVRAFRLRLTSPLHVGEMGIGLEGTLAYVPSDTLFSALAVTWRELPSLAARTAALGDHFRDTPPLLISSAFPYIGPIPLLPRPHLPLLPQAAERAESSAPDDPDAEPGGVTSPKAYKRVQWVSAGVFRRLARGITQAGLNTAWLDARLFQNNSVWLAGDEERLLPPHLVENRTIWGDVRVPKVTVDRLQSASTLFHVGRVHFAAGCGLWFVAQGEPAWLDAVAAGLEVLGDSGMGGQRSRGNGQFTVEAMALPPELGLEQASPAGEYSDQRDYEMLLSRCAPTPAQMARLTAPGAAYQLVTIGGFNGTPGDRPLIRKQVRMLNEGSIIARASGPPGALVDVTPGAPEVPAMLDHCIYRFGWGLGIPLQLPPQEETP